jgi:hypothetical protein
MKKILGLGLLFLSSALFSMDIVQFEQKAATVKSLLNKTHIDSKSVFVPNRLGEVELFHSDKGFCVLKDDRKHVIQKYHTDKMIRDMSKEQLQSFLAVGYVALNQMDNGEYSLKANGRINGGGLIGASIGAFLGKAAVSVVGHGTIQIIGLLSGPAYFPVVIALESCFGPAIETASMAGAVAGGMALAVATGPV